MDDRWTVLVVFGALFSVKIIWNIGTIVYSFIPPLYNGIKKYHRKEAYAIVTGASYGIGSGFALELAKEGFNLVLLARTQSKLEQVAAQARQQGIQVLVLSFDFDNPDYSALLEQIKSLDISVLVNNVGINHDVNEFHLTSLEQLVSIVNINVTTQLRMTHFLLPKMLKTKRAIILNVGSMTGLIPCPMNAVYGASKSFLQHWSHSLFLELKDSGIHVEYLQVGYVATPLSKLTKTSMTVASPESFAKSALQNAGRSHESVPFTGHKGLYHFFQWLPTTMAGRLMLHFTKDLKKANSS